MSDKLDLTKMSTNGPCEVGDMPKGPTVYLEWDSPYDVLPDVGTATLKFKVRKRTTDVANKRYEINIELLSLSDIKGKEKSAIKSRGSETGAALDALRKQMIDGYED